MPAAIVDWIIETVCSVFGIAEAEARTWLFGLVCAVAGILLATTWRWTKQIPGALYRWTCRPARFRKRYLQQVQAAHRIIRLRGVRTQADVQIELDSVYLALRFESNDDTPVGLPEALEAGKGRLVISGVPGSGKTTLLSWMAARLAGGHHVDLGLTGRRLPLLVTLRDFVSGEGSILTAANIQRSAVPEALAETEKPPEGFAERALRKGRCAVLIDGLDEVSGHEARTRVVEELEGLVAEYPRNIYVLTSRPPGLSGLHPAGFTRVSVAPLSNEDIRNFCRHWYVAMTTSGRDFGSEADRREAVHEGTQLANQLAEAILDPDARALRDLARTPLMLTIIAVVHQYRGDLPRRRIELYNEVAWAFLEGRDTTKGITPPVSRENAEEILERLAYGMHEAGAATTHKEALHAILHDVLADLRFTMSVPELVDYLRDRAAILSESRPEEWEFSHLTFQEYFAARRVRSLHRDDGWALLWAHTGDSWWREVILLYAAQCNPGELLMRLLTRCSSDSACLPLAARVLAEAADGTVPEGLGTEVAQAVVNALKYDSAEDDHAQRELAAAAAAILRAQTCHATAIPIARACVDRVLEGRSLPFPGWPDDGMAAPPVLQAALERAGDPSGTAITLAQELMAQLGAAAIEPFITALQELPPAEAFLVAPLAGRLPPEVAQRLADIITPTPESFELNMRAIDALAHCKLGRGKLIEVLHRGGRDRLSAWEASLAICGFGVYVKPDRIDKRFLLSDWQGILLDGPMSEAYCSIVHVTSLLPVFDGYDAEYQLAGLMDSVTRLREIAATEYGNPEGRARGALAQDKLRMLATTRVTDGIARFASGPDQSRARREALHALVQLGVPSSEGLLEPCLTDDDPGIRALAAWVAGKVRDSSARGTLEHLASGGTEPPYVVRAAKEALEAW